MTDYKENDLVRWNDQDWVIRYVYGNGMVDLGWVGRANTFAHVPADWVTPITPPLPPEPPMGSGVFVNARLYKRETKFWHEGALKVLWEEIAADADRAVPEKAHRKQVIAGIMVWLDTVECLPSLRKAFRRDFGSDDE